MTPNDFLSVWPDRTPPQCCYAYSRRIRKEREARLALGGITNDF